ncbi:DUF433 domain-containing protein [Candidatus Poribacteria bacterium]|nr:DUF433 domain-containing protein [Candidatus Poribacteria bacterium]
MMKRERVIHRVLDILGGTPVFSDTRVPVQTLIDYLKQGDSLDDFLKGFPCVSREQAQAFLEIVFQSAIAEEKDAFQAEKESMLEELPPYDWGEKGIPEGKPIEYDPDFGFTVVEEDSCQTFSFPKRKSLNKKKRKGIYSKEEGVHFNLET